MKNNNEYLTTREAADYLGLSIHTIYSLTYYRKIKFSKPGGKLVYFAKADLDAWLNKNSFEPRKIDKRGLTQ